MAAPRPIAARPAPPPRLRQSQRHGSVPNLKGKALAPVPEDSAIVRERSRRMAKRDTRPPWILDLEEMKTGREEWLERERVVLVLGDPSEESLNSILYSTAFAKTLVLVCPLGSETASPIGKWDGIVGSYPVLQAVVPPPTAGASHPLPSLLFAAAAQAQNWLLGRPSTSGSATPNSRLPSFLSHNRSSSATSNPRMTSSESFRSLPPTPIDPYALSAELRETKSRRSSFALGSSSKKSGTKSPNSSDAGKRSPFDVILNFLPSGEEETLQTLLQQTLTLTTGVTPYLMSGPPSKTPTANTKLPISLIHILPANSPPPLEKVLESFLLTLLPSLAPRATQRRAQGLVVTQSVWEAEARMEAAHSLLFGGLSCTVPEGLNVKGRALVRDWRDCTFRDGSEQQEERECVTPTFPIPTPSDLRPRPHTRATAPAAPVAITPPENAPDLISDSSSVSEENSLSSARVSTEVVEKWNKPKTPVAKASDGPKGFKNWMKGKMGRS